jgi:ubiquinone/menaquinone biosynthesis C-methylase UbiE
MLLIFPNEGEQHEMNDSIRQPSSEPKSTYVFDPESPEELTRLLAMDRITTKAMGGPLGNLPDLPENADVLDVACGPGGWVLDVALERQDARSIGIDISQRMIDYANARAQAQKRQNASFRAMDITRRFKFADNSFDLVNGRFLTSVLPSAKWPSFLQECRRITRPGGIIRMTESEYIGLTNSPACEKIRVLGSKLLVSMGHGFSVDGESFGITPVIARLMQKAGIEQVQQSIHMVNFSAGTDAWPEFLHNMELGATLGLRMAQKVGAPVSEDSEALIQQAIMEMHREDFCCIWWFISTWGINPGN